MKTAEFRFRCSYLNSVYFDCIDETGSYEIALRHATSDYERSIYNGSAAEYERTCGAVIDYLVARHGAGPIPHSTLLAFNAWRIAECAKANAHFDANPKRYGEISADDPLRAPSLLARGIARWNAGAWELRPLSTIANAPCAA